MDIKVYMDESFNIKTESEVNSIEIDNLISTTISTLNKKGYLTQACCSGHSSKDEYNKLTVILKKDISKEDFFNWIKENNIEFIKEDEEAYFYNTRVLGDSCYIMFKENIKLPYIPENFKKENNSIYHMIHYFEDDKGKVARSKEELEEEIININYTLTKWANSLPNYTEQNTKSR